MFGGSGNVTLNATTNTGGPVNPVAFEYYMGGTGTSTINVDYSNTTVPDHMLLEGGSGNNTFNLRNIEDDFAYPSTTYIWGGSGTTTINFTNPGFNDSYYAYIPVISVVGLTSQTFADLDTYALTNYIDQYYSQNPPIPNARHPQYQENIFILNPGNSTSYSYPNLDSVQSVLADQSSLGLILAPDPNVIDISKFQLAIPFAPEITGTIGAQKTTSEAKVDPFSDTTITDTTSGATESLTVTVGGSGGFLTDGTGFDGLTSSGAGVYTLSGTAAAVSAELDALVFTPKAGLPNTTSTTTLELRDETGTGASSIDTVTTVTDFDTDSGLAPVITGTVAGQTAVSAASLRPFAGVTITDGNSGATETLTITVGGTGGFLADGPGFSSLMFGSGPGLYTLSGTAAAVTSELDALVFTPFAQAGNTSLATTFDLNDASSVGTNTSDTATTVINGLAVSNVNGTDTYVYRLGEGSADIDNIVFPNLGLDGSAPHENTLVFQDSNAKDMTFENTGTNLLIKITQIINILIFTTSLES